MYARVFPSKGLRQCCLSCLMCMAGFALPYRATQAIYINHTALLHIPQALLVWQDLLCCQATQAIYIIHTALCFTSRKHS